MQAERNEDRGIVFRGVDRRWISIQVRDENGKYYQQRTGLCLPADGDAAERERIMCEARAWRDETERQIEKKKRALKRNGSPVGVTTVRSYALGSWIERRRAQFPNGRWRTDETHLRAHILPALGDRPLASITTRDCVDFVLHLKNKNTTIAKGDGKGGIVYVEREGDKLANQTVINTWSTVCCLFRDAAAIDELIPVSPCLGVRGVFGVLPNRADKRPSEGEYTLAEIVTLITDPRIPEDRRTIYALDFLSGVRRGESSAMRICDWNREQTPITEITVSRAFSSKVQKIKATKTEVARSVPVHPVLAGMLDAWIADGWKRHNGREPVAGDLMFPNARGECRRTSKAGERFRADCALVGVPARNQHRTRHTFITIALEAGKGPDGRIDRDHADAVKSMTHRKRGADAFDRYNHASLYLARCSAVLKIKLPGFENVIPIGRAGGDR